MNCKKIGWDAGRDDELWIVIFTTLRIHNACTNNHFLFFCHRSIGFLSFSFITTKFAFISSNVHSHAIQLNLHIFYSVDDRKEWKYLLKTNIRNAVRRIFSSTFHRLTLSSLINSIYDSIWWYHTSSFLSSLIVDVFLFRIQL